MTWPLAPPVAKLGAFLFAVLTCDLRKPVQISPSAAVLEARDHAAARHGQMLAAASDCHTTPSADGPVVTIAFDRFSTNLTDAGLSTLDAMAARLACAPELTALIVSQGDAHRLAVYRQEVAERRAEAIAARLDADGVPTGRVVRAPPADDAPGRTEGVVLIKAMGPGA